MPAGLRGVGEQSFPISGGLNWSRMGDCHSTLSAMTLKRFTSLKVSHERLILCSVTFHRQECSQLLYGQLESMGVTYGCLGLQYQSKTIFQKSLIYCDVRRPTCHESSLPKLVPPVSYRLFLPSSDSSTCDKENLCLKKTVLRYPSLRSSDCSNQVGISKYPATVISKVSTSGTPLGLK
jgi:hypothetical protein